METVHTYWKRIRSKLGDQPRAGLVALYLEQISGLGRNVEESLFDWEIDFERDTLRRLSRGPNPPGLEAEDEMPLSEIIEQFHPDDAPRVAQLLERARHGEIDHFLYVARTTLPEPFTHGHAFVLILRDQNGKALRALGRRVPFYDLRSADTAFGV